MTDTVSQRSSTIHEETVHEKAVMPSDQKDPYLIDSFEEGDPANPKVCGFVDFWYFIHLMVQFENWSRLRRWYLTIFVGMLVLNATFASAAPSGIAVQLLEEYHMSQEVGTLAISLFVAGYCVGPILWGPLSEHYGRWPIFFYPFVVYTLFQVGCALAKNAATILVLRFLGGTFAAAPLTNSGGVISDIWDSGTRGKALALFTLAPFAGPTIGPTVAGFISTSGTDFRWVFWVLAIFAGVCCLLIVFTLPETYVPVLLARKAAKKRKDTGDPLFHAPMEKIVLTAWERAENILARPFKPMLLAMTLYMSFVYGCIYLLFEAYPIVFTEGHHLSAGISGLMFLPLLLGGTTSVTISIVVFNPRYEREAARLAPPASPPEFRLEMALIAAPLYVVAFFWFGWTSFPSISLWAPLMSGYVLGFAINWIFVDAQFKVNPAPNNLLFLDTYLSIAASALAGNTVVRSVFGAVFPLFATQMYNALGPRWASSLLGFVALIMVPIPIVLMRFGPTIRAKSKFVPV
ncbi:putative mfs-multidrug-resistance transporter [Mycena sanguinolenta]|uniref:Putative mfs-multidrug-resistance transporter n=1 Tax=Mycena sanguinolenta TaxID=230812 RepID=A0A8H7CLC7_9AGAR|nr:putative mfs-multidrug-resistance transporter [Mycena sanguinolenta]